MKILLICPYFFEPHRWMISAYKTALYLSKTTDVVVLTTGSPRFEQINPHLKVYRMWDLFLPDPINYSIVPFQLFQLIRVIRREKPTHFIVNKHMFYTSFCILWLKLMGKKVITVTDTYPGINWLPANLMVKKVMQVYARTIGAFLLKISDRVVLLHEGLIDIAKKYSLRYDVIHNGVDLDEYDQAKPNYTDIDQKYLNILYVGRLESVKGYKDIAVVAKKINQKYKNTCFNFIGSTDGKGEWIKAVATDRIRFLGHRTDIPNLLKAGDVLVLASYSEGLPNAVMEAMACSLPVVSSNVGGVKVLINTEVNGLTFTAGDRAGLAKQLERLITSPSLRKRLGNAARAVIVDQYNWETIAKQYLHLLKSL